MNEHMQTHLSKSLQNGKLHFLPSSKKMSFTWLHVSAGSSTIPQQPSSSGADFCPLWTRTPARGMATDNSKCYGNQRFRRDYITFPHRREGWQQTELLSGIGEATQECVERHKDRNSIHQPNPNMQPPSTPGFWP